MPLLRILLAIVLSALVDQLAAAPSVALFYGDQLKALEFRIFDIVVVEPDHGHDPARFQKSGSQLYAYASVAEVQASRPYFKDIPKSWHLARNGDWDSEVIDQTPANWPDFFADRVIAPLWAKGYRGFFLDTLDSYRLAKQFDEQAQQDGLVRVIETLHKRFPGIRLILNRGFEIVPRLRDKVQMVAAESLFQAWNAGSKRYEEVKPGDREWLLGQLLNVRDKYGIPVLAIDYVAPHKRELARQTAEKIRALGIIPYVADGKLYGMGVGNVEFSPRRLAVIYDGADSPALNYTNAHRYLQMPLNHLGYAVDYFDAQHPLPEEISADRYAGILTWFSGGLPESKGRAMARWLSARIEEGMTVGMLGDFGFPVDAGNLARLGLKLGNANPTRLTIQQQHAMIGFETAPLPDRTQLQPVQSSDNKITPLLTLRDTAGASFIGGALTRWGGFLLDPFVLSDLPGSEQKRWVVDPFAFVQAALRLPAIPIPDVTTENGRRLYFSHIDGDGFPSLAEFPGSPPAPEVLLNEILEKYRIPTAVSIIEAEISPQGLYPKMSAQLEAAAKRMFRLPHVEIASHSYSHPFLWNQEARHGRFKDEVPDGEGYGLHIPGYQFNAEREITGSLNYIRNRLAPPDKPATIMLWTGDCAPGEEALSIVERNGLLNMNGGDTSITRSNPTLSDVGPLSIRKGGYLQIYAPITNENIYTNLWRGPFYGFEKVIETFEMTDQPRRLKPVDIYYHTYSASKPAGIKALHKVFGWAEKQPLHPVYPSDYIRKVQDFETFAIGRRLDDQQWIVRGDGELRTLRLPPALGQPDLSDADGVAGFRPGSEGQYLHMLGSNARFATSKSPRSLPRLFEANARISRWQRQGNETSITFRGNVPLVFSLANASQCGVRADQRPLTPASQMQQSGETVQNYRLPHAAAQIVLSCPAR